MNTQLTKPTEPNIAPFKNHETGRFKSGKDMYEYLALYEKYQEDLAKYNNALKDQEQENLWIDVIKDIDEASWEVVQVDLAVALKVLKSKFTITRK